MNAKQDFASLLFTKDWQSYAYLQAGVHWRLQGDDQRTRQMFQRALSRDRENRGALLNLGILHTEAKRYEWALLTLKRARDAAEEVPDYKEGPIWYKATYQIAATYAYAGNLEESESEAKKLVETALSTLSNTKSSSSGSRSQEKTDEAAQREETGGALGGFLKSSLQLTEILRAGIWIGLKRVKDATAIVLEIEKASNLTYRARYNLGCFYSRLSAVRKEEELKIDAYEKALENLQYAFEVEGSLTKWASNDPALKWLREDDKTKVRDDKTAKEAFAELSAMYAPPAKAKAAEASLLASIAIIGETYAKQLKERGIATEDDLVLKADTATAQKALADGLGINVNLVRRWALLADLMRIVGMDAQSANLLEAAGVGSLNALRSNDAEELARLLYQVNLARSVVAEPPSVEMVRRWIDEAKETTPKVSDGHHRWFDRLPFREEARSWWRRRRDRGE
jgi:hypothetical protein